MKKQQVIKLLLIIFVCLSLGYAIGFSHGAYKSLTWGFDKAVHFLNLKGIEIDMDADQFAYGVMQYKNKINQCYNG